MRRERVSQKTEGSRLSGGTPAQKSRITNEAHSRNRYKFWIIQLMFTLSKDHRKNINYANLVSTEESVEACKLEVSLCNASADSVVCKALIGHAWCCGDCTKVWGLSVRSGLMLLDTEPPRVPDDDSDTSDGVDPPKIVESSPYRYKLGRVCFEGGVSHRELESGGRKWNWAVGLEGGRPFGCG